MALFNDEISPSLIQGISYKKSKAKYLKEFNSLEGFDNNNSLPYKEQLFFNKDNVLTQKTQSLIANPVNQNETSNNLADKTTNEINNYDKVKSDLFQSATNFLNRISSSNPYLNKNIRFTSGHVCYVTNQGVVKYIPSPDVWNSLSIPKNYIQIDLAWKPEYNTPGTQIPTNPPLITGTPLQKGQSVGNEGSNIFVSKFLNDTKQSYLGCYGVNNTNSNLTFIGEKPPLQSNNSILITNGNFEYSQLTNNNHKKFSKPDIINGWWVDGVTLVNNSTAWGFPMPYPSGNYCVSIQRKSYISTYPYLNLDKGSYNLSLYACGRACCTTSSNSSNEVVIDLYDSNNKFISKIGKIYPEKPNVWNTYSFKMQVPSSGKYKIYFTGLGRSDNGDVTTALQGIKLTNNTINEPKFTFEDCKNMAVQRGYQYFGLQQVNSSTSKGYCGVSNSIPAIKENGISKIVTKLIPIWSSNTYGTSGVIATITETGSLAVLDANGKAIFATPYDSNISSNYVGCYKDKSTRAMKNTSNNKYLPWDDCKKLAVDADYKYFGTQNANNTSNIGWCVGSNNLSEVKKYGVATNCFQRNNIMFGDGWSNAVYSLEDNSYYLQLNDDGSMILNKGSGPEDNQGVVWDAKTRGKQKSENPNAIAKNNKYGRNWLSTNATLAIGDYISSNNGALQLVMQPDGNLVLYTFEMGENCSKMADGNIGGGMGANAVYNIGNTSVPSKIGNLAYIDSDSVLYNYNNANYNFDTNYSLLNSIDAVGQDIKSLKTNSLDECKTTCNSTSNCAGFTFNKNDKSCYLKNKSMYPFTRNEGYTNYNNSKFDTYVRSRIPQNIPSGVPESVISTDSLTFNNYIKGKSMKSSYGLLDSSKTQMDLYNRETSKLNNLTQSVGSYNNQLQTYNSKIMDQSRENVKGINNYINDFAKINVAMDLTKKQTSGLENILDDSNLLVLQNNSKYLAWSLATGGLLLGSLILL